MMELHFALLALGGLLIARLAANILHSAISRIGIRTAWWLSVIDRSFGYRSGHSRGNDWTLCFEHNRDQGLGSTRIGDEYGQPWDRYRAL